MRPLNIIMSAFGPYAEEVRINMENLGEKGLYLITGDTGAGKTTIFDAIAFALYGATSGKNREKSMVRSKYAASDTPSFVELEFLYRDEIYKVRRNPEYIRKARRGEGITTEKSNASLELPSGKVISGETNVTREITSILGVDMEQFSQIVMISQGEFQKLLFAPTAEKIEIFRGIFKTDKYQDFQNLLKQKKNYMRKEYENVKNSIKQYIDDVEFKDEVEVENLTPDDVILLVETSIKRDEKNIRENEETIRNNQKEIDKLNVLMSKYLKIEDDKKNLAEITSAVSENKVKKIQLEEKYNLAKEKLIEIEDLKIEKAKIEKNMATYDRLNTLKEEYEKNESIYNDYNEKLSKSLSGIDELNKEIASQENFLNENEGVQLELSKLEIQEATLKVGLESKEEWLEELNKYVKKENELRDKQEIYTNLKSETREILAKYEDLVGAFQDGQAGIMASSLEEGIPCPVCGAKNHPKLAVFSEKIPKESEIKTAKSLLEKIEKQRDLASKEAATLNGLLTERKKSLETAYKKLTGHEKMDKLFIKELIEREKTELGRVSELLLDLRRKVAKLEKVKNSLTEAKKHITKEQDDAEKLKRELPEVKSQMDVSKKVWTNERDNLMYDSKETALQHIKSISIQIEEIESNETSIKKDIDKIEETINVLLGMKKALDMSLQGHEQYDINDISTKRHAHVEMVEIASGKRDMSLKRYNVNARILESIKSKQGELEVVEVQYRSIKNLSDTANGELTGKAKILFETYIQMSYFDAIITKANLRLKKMTNGQYDLKRSDSGRLNTQSGLDLTIIDHYNGSERDIKTLSGGESFKASLSLALGLADVIEANVGGIKLDTMFIDEGFGSLDEDSLRNAIDTLSELAGSNRLIGIISHVKDLKDSIDNQILVRKMKSGGSEVEMRC